MRGARVTLARGCFAHLVAVATASCFAATAAATPPHAPDVDLSAADRCDFIGEQQGSRCLLPFPDDYYTVEDASTATGRRVDLRTAAMPANAGGVHIDAAPYNASDGFSPGQAIVVRVPGLDSPEALERTGAAPINDIGRFRAPDQPIVVIDAETGKRWPIWTEIDSTASSPEDTALLIHPAENFAAEHRYIVAMRDLRTAGGEEIPAPAGFRYYRDHIPTKEPVIEAQRDRFRSIFRDLNKAHVKRKSLYLAWDFTVASDLNIARRALHMRDAAFGSLGDTDLADLEVQGASPKFTVTDVQNFTPAQDPELARRVKGTLKVPCFMSPSCAPGGTLALDGRGLPTRTGVWNANFDCTIPRSAVDGTPAPARPIVYGHGLFGGAGEVGSGLLQELASEHGFVICATDEIGMSGSDVPTTIGILSDLSGFPKLADRLQQGLLNELFLGRLMIHPQGLVAHPAFRASGAPGSPPVIDTSRLYYNGNSQGGIMGGALTALSPDFTQSALGVAAMRYSLLLSRAVPFDTFAAVLYPSYPDELSRPLILSMIQMLWDRGEPNGYAHRMTTDPLPDTPEHRVLINVALGDHQVTNFASDVEARTIGASAHVPILDDGRWPGVDVLWGVPPIPSYPFDGSAIFYWDTGPVRPDPLNPAQTIGVPTPPLTNLPNRGGEDPHGAPRGASQGLALISQFLSPTGVITDVCGGQPCYAGGWTGL